MNMNIMNRENKLIWIAKIIITLAFILMICYGFAELIRTNFESYDTSILKLSFWTANPAHTLWNILIILGFFIFILSSIWSMQTLFFYWVWGGVYSVIGILTLIFTLIENLNDGTKLAMGVIISLLLIIGAGLILFEAIKIVRNKKVKTTVVTEKTKIERK